MEVLRNGSGYILKIQMLRFADGLGVMDERSQG